MQGPFSLVELIKFEIHVKEELDAFHEGSFELDELKEASYYVFCLEEVIFQNVILCSCSKY